MNENPWLTAIRREVRGILPVLVAVLMIQTFIFRPYWIPSSSMVPTLLIGDFVLVSKFSYGWSRYSFPFLEPPIEGRVWKQLPDRGDVAVFRLPRDPSTVYIKRIVGLPGDHLQMIHGVLTVNGEPVKRVQIEDFVLDPGEPDTAQKQYTETLPGGRSHSIIQNTDEGQWDNTQEYVVPPNNVFAMGDNRENSADSRIPPQYGGVGYVPVDNLVGRAEFRMFHIDLSTVWWHVWEWPFAISFSRSLTAVR